MTSPQSRKKLTSNGNFTNSVMPTALNAVGMRPKKKKHVAGDPDLEIWLMPLIE
jgi:arylsulfatase A-like enzyme